MNKKNWGWYFLVCLFVIGVCYRLTAIYPLPIGNDSKTNALQAYYVLEGALPFFYPGQAWMGTSGIYLLALIYKLIGVSTLTFGLYAWMMSCFFFFFAVFLGYKLFGLETAIFTALLFMIPNHELMEWTSQVRPDYEIMFFLAPIILMLTYVVINRFQHNKSFISYTFCLAFLSGFGIWTNLGIAPAVITSVLLLCFHLRLVFIKRLFSAYVIGAILGFFPVIYYNLFYDFVFFKQSSSFSNLAPLKLIKVLFNFFTNALPFFWGVNVRGFDNWVMKIIFVFVLLWIIFLFGLALRQGFKRWKNKEKSLGFQIVFLYFFLHMFVASASAFGNRFAHGSSPIPYITVLYSVAFVILAAVIALINSKKKKILFFLPLLLFMGNNLVSTLEYPSRFLDLLKGKLKLNIVYYPVNNHPYLTFLDSKGLENGYGGAGNVNDFRLLTLGKATIADFYQEDYLNFALKSDSSKQIFWLDPPFGKDLTQIGCSFNTETVAGHNIAFNFFKKKTLEEEIRVSKVTSSLNRITEQFLVDRNVSTTWDIDKSMHGAKGILTFTFEKAKNLNKIIIVPKNYFFGPRSISIEVSPDGSSWQEVYSTNKVLPVFWSIYHPFFKVVKPRLEFILLNNYQSKYCRITIPIMDEDSSPVSISEIYFYGELEGKALSEDAFNREVAAILTDIENNYANYLILADHWFSNYFKQKQRQVDFISNRYVNDCGKKNLHDSFKKPYMPYPIPREKSICIIAEKAQSVSLAKLLQKHSLAFEIKKFDFFDLLLVDTSQNTMDFYWNGFDLNAIVSGNDKSGNFAYPSLATIFKDVVLCDYIFAENFQITAQYINYTQSKKNIELAFELLPIKTTERVFYLFVHFLNEKGEIVFQGDIKMETFAGETNLWKPGRQVLLNSLVSVPDFVSGKIAVKIGIWCPETGKRLKLINTGDDEVIIDKIII